VAAWPQWFLDLCRKPEPEPTAETFGGKVRHPYRHRHLFSLAGTMRKRGMSDAAVLAALRAENQAVCEPPLSDAEVTKIAAGIKRYPAGEGAPGEEPSPGQGSRLLVALSLEEFLAHKFPPREPILAPWLVRQSLVMIYAWRGVGKTYFALEVAYAVATGGEFLGWKAPKPRKVLYLDGEMPGALMQKRLASIVAASERGPAPGMLKIVNPDLQGSFMPDLATLGGQAAIENVLEADTDLIVVDSISALVRRGGRENEAESWLTASEWAIWKRSQGLSILFNHHAGKDGEQRGTSKREDHLDVSIFLRRPPNYDARDGAVFETIWKKGRDMFGEDVEPIEATLSEKDGKRIWTMKSVSKKTAERVAELVGLGMTDSEIA
jgi:hypothetical protein